MSITVRVCADNSAEVRACDVPRLTVTADEALELFTALDEEIDRCYRCNQAVFLDLVGVCEGHGAYCSACGHGDYRGCGCDPVAVAI